MKCCRPRDQQQELADQARLLRAWRAWQAEQLEETRRGPHGSTLVALMLQLDRLELSSAALFDFMRSVAWDQISYDTRLTALPQINQTISKLRERHGLAAPLPLKPNAFLLIKQMLFPSSPTHERQLSPSEVATGRDATATVQTE
jgi:hypothetical protein